MKRALCTLALLAAAARPAQAQMRVDGLSAEAPPKILILTLRGAGVTTPYISFQERARAEIESHLFVRLISMDETFAPGGVVHGKLEACRGEPACLAGLVGKLEAKYLLVITASLLGDVALLGSRMIDLSALKVLGEAVDQVPGERPDFLGVLPARIRASVPPELWDPFGTLEIAASQPGAQIRINGRIVGTSPLGRLGYLLPGEYKLEAVKDGFQPAQGVAKIERQRELKVRLDLAEIATPSSSGWVLWVVIGAVAVAGAATAAVLLTSSGGRDPTFCSAASADRCPQ